MSLTDLCGLRDLRNTTAEAAATACIATSTCLTYVQVRAHTQQINEAPDLSSPHQPRQNRFSESSSLCGSSAPG